MAETQRDQLYAIKETLIGITIAFTMAFVFRGFVIEGFVIPTGSMAPTLLGAHYRMDGPESGYAWPVGPGSRQKAGPADLTVTDPMLGTRVVQSKVPRQAGDRVFVLKYLDSIHDPKRWDVVVFKNPGTRENYIKRLVGLPGEQLAFVDGDLFVRPYVDDGATPRSGVNAWSGDGWAVQRKPERVQRAVFQTVSDSTHAPARPDPGYRSPWVGGAGWEGLTGDTASSSFRYAGAGGTTLRWRDARSPNDWYPYNESSPAMPHFPVSDLSLSLGVEPDGPDAGFAVVLEARGREFVAESTGGPGGRELVVKMRQTGAGAWTELDRVPLPSRAMTPGRVTSIEFWHVDQAVWVFVDGSFIAGGLERGAYELSPAERVEAATGRTLAEAIDPARYGDGVTGPGGLSDAGQYRRPAFRWEFSGGPLTLHRVKLERDLHYHNRPGGRGQTGGQTNGGHPDYFPTLGDDRYFVCGDNSPNSKDSRLRRIDDGGPDPWVAGLIDPKVPSTDPARLTPEQHEELLEAVGTVHRDLLIGQGFVVYFPAPRRFFGVPVPDIGRVRWIW